MTDESRFFHITNNGPEVISTNFWDKYFLPGKAYYVSINAEAFRLLIQKKAEFLIPQMTENVTEVIITEGEFEGHPYSFELMFEDGSPTPFALHTGSEVFQTLPGPRYYIKERTYVFSVWKAGPNNEPIKCLELPARLRKTKKLPYMKPWGADYQVGPGAFLPDDQIGLAPDGEVLSGHIGSSQSVPGIRSQDHQYGHEEDKELIYKGIWSGLRSITGRFMNSKNEKGVK